MPRSGLPEAAPGPIGQCRRHLDDGSLDDPAAPTALAVLLAADSDPAVRARAAEDPRRPEATVLALLADPDLTVRQVAARHPALPAPTLAALLRDPATVEDAARNPAVPLPVAGG